MTAVPERTPPPVDVTHHIVHVEHTEWQLQPASFHERLLAGDADETLGRILLEHLGDHPFVAMREPDSVPPSRMFHALAWLAQQGHRLEQRDRIQQTEFERRNSRQTRRQQWRIAVADRPVHPIQTALF